MEILKSLNFNLLSLSGFCICLGVIRLLVPNNFKSIFIPLTELLLMLLFVSSFLRNMPAFNLEDNFYLPQLETFSSRDLQDGFIKAEIESFLSEYLYNEGIITNDIEINLYYSDDMPEINSCCLSVAEESKAKFLNKQKRLEKELGIVFKLEGDLQ